jgi:23S rRNA pseudouridine1911/1915/1917 synthase
MSAGRRTVVVPPGEPGRVDRVVADATGLSRSHVQRLISEGRLTAGGDPLRANTIVAAGAELVLDVPASAPADLLPEPDIPVAVVYEDDDLLIVDKPAGLVVHPSAGHAGGTLVNALLGRAGAAEYGGIAGVRRPGIVHRLDRDTSGLMVVARSARAYDALTSALAARPGPGVSPEKLIERRYLALAWGRFDARRGTIDAPIGRSATRRTRMAIREAGKDARTGYEVLTQYEHPVCALVECRLETGRTHQIRVHLAAIGHPVVGDGPYGGDRNPLQPGRPFLHAHALAVEHPVTGERLEFTDPLPPELGAVLTTLGDPPAPRP